MAERSRPLQIIDQPAQMISQAPGSVRDPVTKNKVEQDVSEVKAVVVNPDSLSLVPSGLLAEEENQLLRLVL